MAIKQREYLFGTNDFNQPDVLTGRSAIGTLLVRLILMTPGKNPLHPTMGVGVKNYRHGIDNLEDFRKTVEYQIKTFLPCYQNASVAIIVTPDKVCNIEITINDIVYVYDSAKAPVPIKLADIAKN